MKDGDIVLKVADDKHLPFLVKWGNAAGLRCYKKNKKKTNLKIQAELLKSMAMGLDQTFIIQVAGDDTPAGVIEVLDVNMYDRTCFINIYIDNIDTVLPVHGYTIIDIVLEYLFKRMGLFKISVEIPADDSAYITLFKQHDFRIEVRKRAHLYVAGSYKTILEMALLKHEYEQRK